MSIHSMYIETGHCLQSYKLVKKKKIQGKLGKK